MARRAHGNPSTLSNLATHFRSPRYASTTSLDSLTQFEKMVKTRCQSKDVSVSEVLGYFNSMLEMKPMPSIWTVNHLFGSLSKLNQCSTVVSMYKSLVSSRFREFYPDVSTMNILVKCLGRSGNAESGFSVMATMVKRGIRDNARTLSTLLDLLCKQGSVNEAMELIEKMEIGQDPESHVVVYGTLIDGLCKSGESRRALMVLRRMMRPNAYCFCSAIDGLCKEGLVDEALSLFLDMVGRGIRPNVVLYTCLIDGLCKAERRDEAKGLLADMLGRKIAPDVKTYYVFVTSLCKDEEFEEAMRLFEDMVGRGLVPDIFFYNRFIGSLSQSGKWREVALVLEKMKGHGLSPNIGTFRLVLDARFKEGNDTAALRLVGAMSKRATVPDDSSDEVAILARDMDDVDIFADTQTLSILLNGFCSGFMMMEAQKLFDVMIERGLVNKVTFTTIINGYCLQGEMEKAQLLFDQMEVNGVTPDTVAYNVLANGYLKVRRVDDALKVIKDLVTEGLQPNSSTQNILKSIYSFKHEAEFINSKQGETEEVDSIL